MSQDRTGRFQLIAHKLEWFDPLAVIYIAVIVREYFWTIPHNRVAWLLTTIVTAGLAAAYLATKEAPAERQPKDFWLIVAVPLFLIYLLRVGYPDLSFDVLNYRIFHSERALRGLLHIPGDFAPAYFPFFNNPAPDMVTGIFRHLLGFRLGTIINYLVLLWTGSILFKFFRDEIKGVKLRSVAVLVVLLSEQFLAEINTYMVDLLALPLLMGATCFALRADEISPATRKHYILISFFLGMSVALKLTNLVFAVPIGLVVLRKLLATRKMNSAQMMTAGSMAVASVLPVLPHALYLCWVTRNPVFPLYNKLFQSPLWAQGTAFDGRWGPEGFWQTLFWPFEILFRHQRLTELNVYSGKISVGLVVVFFLMLLRREQCFRRFGFIFISGAFLWSLGTGYIRYGLFLDLLGGISLVMLAMLLWRSASRRVVLHRGLSLFLSAVLILQAIMSIVYTWKTEWGGRSIGLLHPGEYGGELTQVLQDRSLTRYMSSAELAMFDGVGAWIETGIKTSALTAMLRPDLPYLNVFAEAFIATPAALRKFSTAVSALEGRKLLSIVFEDSLDTAVAKLQKRGFTVIKATPLRLGYFSASRRIPLIVIEVERDPRGRQTQDVFNAEIVVLQGPPKSLKTGEHATIRVRVRNISGKTWPSKQVLNHPHQVTLGNKWLDHWGGIVVNDDGRASLPSDLLPQGEFELDLPIRAPAEPGTYFLMLDMVQEQVSWFYEQGSTPVEMEIVVVD